jgi:hypothetical protein
MARWKPDSFEAYAGAITRQGRSRTRSISLPAELRNASFEIFVYQVGGKSVRLGTGNEPRLQYVPWQSGVYWILACRSDACFVIAASRQGA